MSSQFGLRISRAGQADRVVGLSLGEHIIGRSLTSSVVLSDHGISRQHLRLVVKNDVVMIEDLKSGNGTFVNGERIDAPCILKYEQEVRLGLFSVRLTVAPATPSTEQPEEYAWLEEVGIGVVGRSYPVKIEGSTIGRSVSRDIILNDSTVSRAHCEILFQNETWMVVDNGSANGISLNGEPVVKATLQSGDELCVGSVSLRFTCQVPPDYQKTMITKLVESKSDLNDCSTEEWPEPTINEPKGNLLPTVLLWTFVVCVLLFTALLAVMVLVPNGSISAFFK